MSAEPMPQDDGVPRPVGRFEWERLIRRTDLPIATKGLAYTLAQYGSKAGSNAHPGVDRLARVCRMDEKTVRRHLLKLRQEGFLVRAQESDWRRRATAGIADEYQLTCPMDYLERRGYLTPDEENEL